LTTAIFPGRFQPPHLGHVLTILNVAKKYDRVIVAVVDLPPSIMPPEESAAILKRVFEGRRKIRVIHAGTPLMLRLRYDDLPRFDVVVTGNVRTAEAMYARGFKVDIMDETREYPYWSGAWIRRKMAEG